MRSDDFEQRLLRAESRSQSLVCRHRNVVAGGEYCHDESGHWQRYIRAEWIETWESHIRYNGRSCADGWHGSPNSERNASCKTVVDWIQDGGDVFGGDVRVRHMAKLESVCVNRMLLCKLVHRKPKPPGLSKWVIEGLKTPDLAGYSLISYSECCLRGGGQDAADLVWRTRRFALEDLRLHVTITVVVVNWANWSVDWEEVAIRGIVAVGGRVVVRHETPLEERIRDKGHSINNVRRCKADGLGLGKVVGRISIKDHFPERYRSVHLERNDLRDPSISYASSNNPSTLKGSQTWVASNRSMPLYMYLPSSGNN